MKCENINKKLIFYINYELKDSQIEEINNHLQTCENCNKLYNELVKTLSLIERRITLEPNPYLYTRVKQRLDEISNKEKSTVFSPFVKRVLQPVLLSFLLIFGVIFGIKLGNTYKVNQKEKLSISQSTEFYFNDFEQEKLETFLLND